MPTKLRLAVYKFASCDGCQLQLLDAQGKLLEIARRIDIDHFLEARSQVVEGPYDIALVEGSITTAEDAERIQKIRRDCRYLVTLGACATAGGIQALRNWGNIEEFVSAVYATRSTRDNSWSCSQLFCWGESRTCPPGACAWSANRAELSAWR